MTAFTSWQNAYRTGLEAIHKKQFADAAEALKAAVASKPDRWEPYYAFAWVLIKGEDFLWEDELAESCLMTAIEKCGPACSDAHVLLGMLQHRRGDSESALESFLKGVGRSSMSDEAEKGVVGALARLLCRIEEEAENGEGFDKCTRYINWLTAASLPSPLHNGLLAEILVTRAACYQRVGDAIKAEDDFRQVARLAPGHPRIPEAIRRSPIVVTSGARLTNEPTLDDIGGRDVVDTFQYRLCRLFEMRFASGDLEEVRRNCQELGQAPMRSYLLFGPSGCGKTYIVRAFSGEYRRRHGREMPIFRMRLNEMHQKYVGESEKALTKIINDAIQAQPSILFADEVDAMGGARDGGQDWRVGETAHMLQELDRTREQEAFVTFFGCTNRLWSIDMALLRRFDQLIPVEMPNEQVREQIFRVQFQKLGPKIRPIDPPYKELAIAAHGLTAGDIEKIIRQCVDEHASSFPEGRADAPLPTAKIIEMAKAMDNFHVVEWVRQSAVALRKMNHESMAEEIEKKYTPYLREKSSPVVTQVATQWVGIPEGAWNEEANGDVTWLRRR